MRIRTLLHKIKEYNPNANFELIKKAHDFAKEIHKDEKRASGKSYILHPIETAYILAELKLDSVSIASALLHDVIEDSEVKLEQIKDEFGNEIASIVDGVTKLSLLKYEDRGERNAESIRKMFLATTKDIRVLFIKLADRLHNMRTLNYLQEEKQKRIAQDTLDIYSPLAYRLGIASIKWEMEDLAFKHIHKEMYKKFKEKFGKKRWQREIEIQKIKRVIDKKLKEHSISGKISGRPKHFYSIYKKMIKKKRSFDELYDLIGIRVVTKTIKECYEVLGIVHSLWKPIPGEFDDYIAMPKANMYQSLHTAVLGQDGNPIEIQIRTEEMHKTAEEGIAAHWEYKGMESDKQFDKKLSWLRQILDWQRESTDTKEFMEYLHVDFFEDEIYVFTPESDVISLPKGATPIDFAYAVHSNIGERCIGAIVNGRIVPLRHTLRNGDIIRILTSKTANPKRDWLKIVKTTKAKNKIKQFIRQHHEIPVAIPTKKEPLKVVSEKGLVEVEGIRSPKITLAKCCHPVPEDKIEGYATLTNRVTIHKKGCHNIAKYKARKKIDVDWKKELNVPLLIKINGTDRVGLFADILNTVAAAGTNVDPAKGRTIGNNQVECTLGIVPEDSGQVKDLIDRIKRIKSVTNVYIETEE